MASFGNCLHDADTVRDLQNLASEIDNVKIENASIDDANGKLTRLQGRIVNELVLMRRHLRDASRVIPLADVGGSSPPTGNAPPRSSVKWRMTKAGALVVVIASLFIGGAGFVGEREFGNSVGFWLYWEAIIFLAVWTLERAIWTVFGVGKHTIWMFRGWVLLCMVLASLLCVLVGPIVLLLTLNVTLGVTIMFLGVALWFIAAVAWARYEHLQNRERTSPQESRA